MLYWSQDKNLLRWAVLTKCGKTTFVDLPRGSKRPLEVPCCGLSPLDPSKINYSLKDSTKISFPESKTEEESEIIIEEPIVECNIDMANNQSTETTKTEKLTSKSVAWPDVQELSRLVNSQSLRSLAKQLNTSTGSIKKHCAKLEIKIPAARFNWSKV
jgi:hypothetical protein